MLPWNFSESNRKGFKLAKLRGFMLTACRIEANLGTRRLKLAALAWIRQDVSIKLSNLARLSPLSSIRKSVRVACSAVFRVNAYLFARVFLINEIFVILFEVRSILKMVIPDKLAPQINWNYSKKLNFDPNKN